LARGIFCYLEFIERLDYQEGIDVTDNLEIIGKPKRKKTHRGALADSLRCVGYFNALRGWMQSIVFSWSMLCHEQGKVLSIFRVIGYRFDTIEFLHFRILFNQ
jgi:hypothetical protein